jgi:hypothetical protein
MNTASFNVWRIFLVSLLALISLSPSHFDIMKYENSSVMTVDASQLTPNGSEVSNPTRLVLNNIDYCIQSSNHHVSLTSCEPDEKVITFWQSPSPWQVNEAFFADLNRDGEQELTLLVRRPFKTWPVDKYLPYAGRIADFQDQDGFSCHIILIGWKDGKFQEVWAGSPMSDPVRQVKAYDLDEDGFQELIALEYAYDGSYRDGSLVIWRWSGFAFTLDARVDGSYSTLRMQDDGNHIWLFMQ